jgi:transposase
VFYRLASPIALAFLADYPTPPAAARLGQAPMASLLPPAQLPRRQATGGAAGQVALSPDRPGRHPAGHPGHPVRAQVQLLRALVGTIAELEAAIAKRVAYHPRAKLLASLPGVGTINLAQLLAEVGPILNRVPSAEHAAAECGAAPVTKASGKTSGV